MTLGPMPLVFFHSILSFLAADLACERFVGWCRQTPGQRASFLEAHLSSRSLHQFRLALACLDSVFNDVQVDRSTGSEASVPRRPAQLAGPRQRLFSLGAVRAQALARRMPVCAVYPPIQTWFGVRVTLPAAPPAWLSPQERQGQLAEAPKRCPRDPDLLQARCDLVAAPAPRVVAGGVRPFLASALDAMLPYAVCRWFDGAS